MIHYAKYRFDKKKKYHGNLTQNNSREREKIKPLKHNKQNEQRKKLSYKQITFMQKIKTLNCKEQTN